MVPLTGVNKSAAILTLSKAPIESPTENLVPMDFKST